MSSEDLFRLLFATMSDGMMLMEDGVLIDCNQAVLDNLGCADKSQVIYTPPTAFAPERQPDGQLSSVKAAEMIARVHEQGNVRFEWVHRRADGSLMPVEISLTVLPVEGRDVLGCIWHDIGPRKEMEEQNQRRLAMEALTAQISLRLINLPASAVDVGIIQALRELGEFVRADRTYVFLYSPDNLHMSCHYEWFAPGIAPRKQEFQHVPLDRFTWMNGQLMSRQTVYVPRTIMLPPQADSERLALRSQGIQSLIATPMESQGRVIGFLGFNAMREERVWSEDAINLLRTLAGVFSSVLERRRAEEALRSANQQLEQRVWERTHELERRRHVAESLRETIGVLNSNRPPVEILDYLVMQAREVIGASACTLHRIDEQGGTIRMEAWDGWPDELIEPRTQPLTSGFVQAFADTIRRGRVTHTNFPHEYAAQALNDPDLSPADRERRFAVRSRYSATLSVPLFIRRALFGCLIFYYQKPQEFPQEQVRLAETYAEQAALAIENAHLHARVEQAAAEAERGRLARDLHDSVTQTLFSASLIAEVLPRIWERSPDDGRAQLEELRLLTRGALAEMRTLLLELRPAALMRADLGEALRHLVEAARGRAGIDMALHVDGQGDLPGDIKMALYRIAQEALNNVVKHADARSATVRLVRAPAQVRLCIADDGCGFNVTTVPPESLGLGIMTERAQAIGAQLQIDSGDSGTQVSVVWERKGG